MEIELERTFLLKEIPAGMGDCKSVEIVDIYIPEKAEHPFVWLMLLRRNFLPAACWPGSDIQILSRF